MEAELKRLEDEQAKIDSKLQQNAERVKEREELEKYQSHNEEGMKLAEGLPKELVEAYTSIGEE